MKKRIEMKKIVILAGIAAAALFASCTKEQAPADVPQVPAAPSTIILNLEVAGLGDTDTKAVKTGWVSGDVLDIWYDNNNQKTPDLVVKYDGSAWAVDGSASVSGNVPSAGGTLNAVYFSAGNEADYSFDGGVVSAPQEGGTVVSDLVAYAQKMAYTYAGNTLTSALSSWEFLSNTQIVLAGEDIDASGWSMKCDGLKVASGFTFSDGGIVPDVSPAGGAFVFGQPNADGIAFNFVADSDEEKDYEFAIDDITGDQKYYYTASSKTLSSSSAVRNAVKIAREKFGIDYYRNFLDGKDLVIGTKTFKKSSNSYTLVSADTEMAAFKSICDSYDVVFVENGVNINNTSSTTLILSNEKAIVGRKDNGVQPYMNLAANNFNIVKGAALKNVCIRSTGAAAPIQNASATSSIYLIVEDCTVFAKSYMIYDRSTTGDFASMTFNNSILASESTLTAMFMYVAASKTTKAEPYEKLSFTNCVLIFSGTPGSGNAYTFRLNSKDSDGKMYEMPNLTITFDHNTLYNLCAGYAIQVGSCKQVNFDNNVWESALSSGTSANLFSLGASSAAVKPAPATSTAFNNYLYASNYDGETYRYRFGTPSSTYFKFIKETDWNATWKGGSGAGSLLGDINASKFYFPVNSAKVGTAGASYDTKKWVLRDWSL